MPDFQTLAGFIAAHVFALLAVLAVVLALGVVLIVAVGRWVLAHREAIRARLPFTPPRYFALHLVLGLALSLAAVAFLGLAEEVGERAGLVTFDVALAEALHRTATPAQVRGVLLFTALGSGPAITVVGLVVLALLLRRRHRALAIGWVVALAGGGLLNEGLKLFYRRPRPVLPDPVMTLQSWSFPSGHSMGTFIVAGMLAYFGVLFLRTGAARVAAVAAALVWAVLIGFSRIFLGVHYFSDVVAGYAAGAVWVTACISGVELVRRRRGRGAAGDLASGGGAAQSKRTIQSPTT